MTATKNEVIKHINKLFENKTHTPDAAAIIYTLKNLI